MMTKEDPDFQDNDFPKFTLIPEQKQSLQENLKEQQEGKIKAIDPHDFNQIYS